jgi:hypothetical protein
VPNKQAAQPRAARPAAPRPDRDGPKDRTAPDTGRKARPADGRGSKPARGDRADAGGHGIPRRNSGGSALSLRAGARRGRTSR